LRNILERFVGKAADDAKAKGVSTADEIRKKLDDVRQMAGGYDFSSVITAYARGYEDGSDEMQSAALRCASKPSAAPAEPNYGAAVLLADPQDRVRPANSNITGRSCSSQ